jgi:hypothetical protein
LRLSPEAQKPLGPTASRSIRPATYGITSDFLRLAKLPLEQGTDGSKDVAAVLTAAAFEDTIRRMRDTLADEQGRPALEEVIGKLKSVGVLN